MKKFNEFLNEGQLTGDHKKWMADILKIEKLIDEAEKIAEGLTRTDDEVFNDAIKGNLLHSLKHRDSDIRESLSFIIGQLNDNFSKYR